MEPYERIKEYSLLVCDQIRWKKVQGMIATEIENHLVDQRDAYIAAGSDELTATDLALEEMGDPVKVGAQLDRAHRPRIEWGTVLLTLIMLSIGILINYFVGSTNPNHQLPNSYYFNMSIVAAIIGIAGMATTYFVDFSILGKYPKAIYALLALIILIATIPAIEVNGAIRHIRLPIIGDVPLSAFLLMLPTAYAGIIYSMRDKGYLGILLCGAYFVGPVALMLYCGLSVSNLIHCAIICFVLLTYSICKGLFNIKRTAGMFLVFVPTVLISLFLSAFLLQSFRVERLRYLFNASADPYGKGFVPTVIGDILTGAKFIGQGDLPARFEGEISGWLASMNVNYIITYLIHRIGWIALIGILAVFAIFFIRGIYLCKKQKSVLGKLVSISILINLALEILVYVSSNLGYLTLTQITLPFISYAGLNNVVHLCLIGILLSIYKTGYLINDCEGMHNNNGKLFEYIDGKLIIYLKQNNYVS